MKTLAIGIDIGGTRTKIGLVDLASGVVNDMLVTPTETKNGEQFLQRIGAAISQLKDKAIAKRTQLAGVGVGVPGFVFANGVVDSTYGFLEFMEDYPLASYIQERHGLPCLLDNDARVVALGEATFGQGSGFSRVLVLTLGTGLGLGLTVDGRLDDPLPVAHMGGHLTITTNDTVCYCGKTGCLESLVSSAGLLRIANRLGWSPEQAGLPPTAETIFNQKKAGNPLAGAIVDEYIGYLQTGIDNYVNLYAPDIIVLGGGMAKGLMGETDRLHNACLLSPYKAYKTRVTISDLEEKAGIVGSALLFKPERLAPSPNEN